MQQTVKERLKEFIKSKGLTDRAFCRMIDVSSTFVSSMRTSIQPDKLNRIAVRFPELNTGWLMTGEGEMLKGNLSNIPASDQISMPKEVFDLIKSQQETLLSQQRTIENITKK